ncbi:hypothetical protein [Modicisalibacter luteus]|uniref:hypothetical protein n=1 Tax=Modicisalibacter luteus TaxID=453962 RepID=UPI00363B66D7
MAHDRVPGDEERHTGSLVTNRVLLTLLVAALLGVVLLPFASMAPNRLMSGQAVGVTAAMLSWQWLALAGLAGILTACALSRPFPAG